MANNNNNNILQDPRSEQIFSALEADRGLPQGALRAVMKVESGGKANALSSAGARGAFQFMPETAKQYNVDVSNPWDSARGAADYLGDLVKQYKGNFAAALAHYNGGAHNAKYQVDGTVPSAAKVSPKNHEVNKAYVRDVLKYINPISSANASEQPPSGTEVTNPTPQAATPAPQPTKQSTSAKQLTTEQVRNIAGIKVFQAKQRGLSDDVIVKGLIDTAPPEIATAVQNNLKLGVSPANIVKGIAAKQFAQYEQDKADADPTKNMTGLQKVAAGYGREMVNIGKAAQELWTRATGTDDDLKKLHAEEAQRQQQDQALMNTGAGQVGAAAGVMIPMLATMGASGIAGLGARGVAMAAARGGVVGETALGAQRAAQAVNAVGNATRAGVNALPTAVRAPINAVEYAAKSVANPTTVGQAVTGGAVQGALTPTTDDGQIGQNMAMGAAGGAVGAGIAKVAGMAARPLGRTVAEQAPTLVKQADAFNLPLSAANIAKASKSDNLLAKGAAHAVSSSEATNLAVQHAIAKELGEGVGVHGATIVDSGLLSKNPYEHFNTLNETLKIPVSRATLARDLAPALEKYRREANTINQTVLNEVDGAINKFAPDARGVNPNVSPALLQQTAQSFAKQVGYADQFEKPLLAAAKEVFENSLEKGLAKHPMQAEAAGTAAMYRTAKDQFAKQQVIKELLKKNSDGAGNVTPIQLIQSIKNAALDGQYSKDKSHYGMLADTLHRLYGKNGMPINRSSELTDTVLSGLGGATSLATGGVGGIGAAAATVAAKRGAKHAVNSTNPLMRNALTGNTGPQRFVGKYITDPAVPILAQSLAAYASKNNK